MSIIEHTEIRRLVIDGRGDDKSWKEWYAGTIEELKRIVSPAAAPNDTRQRRRLSRRRSRRSRRRFRRRSKSPVPRDVVQAALPPRYNVPALYGVEICPGAITTRTTLISNKSISWWKIQARSLESKIRSKLGAGVPPAPSGDKRSEINVKKPGMPTFAVYENPAIIGDCVLGENEIPLAIATATRSGLSSYNCEFLTPNPPLAHYPLNHKREGGREDLRSTLLCILRHANVPYALILGKAFKRPNEPSSNTTWNLFSTQIRPGTCETIPNGSSITTKNVQVLLRQPLQKARVLIIQENRQVDLLPPLRRGEKCPTTGEEFQEFVCAQRARIRQVNHTPFGVFLLRHARNLPKVIKPCVAGASEPNTVAWTEDEARYVTNARYCGTIVGIARYGFIRNTGERVEWGHHAMPLLPAPVSNASAEPREPYVYQQFSTNKHAIATGQHGTPDFASFSDQIIRIMAFSDPENAAGISLKIAVHVYTFPETENAALTPT